MENSTTYRWLLRQGEAKGKAEGNAEEARAILLRIGATKFGRAASQWAEIFAE